MTGFTEQLQRCHDKKTCVGPNGWMLTSYLALQNILGPFRSSDSNIHNPNFGCKDGMMDVKARYTYSNYKRYL